MNTPTDRAAAINALRTELRQIGRPVTADDPWWAKVQDVNARLAAEGQEQILTNDLSSYGPTPYEALPRALGGQVIRIDPPHSKINILDPTYGEGK